MNTPSLLDYVTAIGAIATPLLVLLLGGAGWVIKNRIERTLKREEALRSDRVNVYNDILEPFIIMFAKDDAIAREKEYRGKDKGTILNEKITSIRYRQAGFKLSLMGSDNVVRSYNELMQFFYTSSAEEISKMDPRKTMGLLGDLLL